MTVDEYEAALWPLRRPNQHVYMGSLPCDVTPATTTVAGRAPFSAANVAAWSTVLPEILDKAATALCLQASSAMALDVVESHFSVADAGASNDLTPTFDAAIGTLLIVPPSAYTGGSLAWTLGATTTTLEPTTEARYVVVPPGAVLASAPITSGTQLVLVFDIVRRHPRTNAILLSSREAVLHELTRIASTPMLQDQRIAHVLADPVGPADAAIIDVLVATRRFDVALVTVDDGVVRTCRPHPSCGIPDAIVASLVGKRAHRFLRSESGSNEKPTVALLFWPTQYRAGIVGLAAALQSSAEPSASSYLGLGGVRDLLLGTLAIFTRAVLSGSEERRPSAFLPPLCDCLLASGDVDLIDVFVSEVLGSALRFRDLPRLTTLAELVRSCLTTLGWCRLGGAVERLVASWVEHNVSAACQLLASFAGVTNAPLCAALDGPFVGECIKSCFDVICTYRVTSFSSDVGASYILLDAYLDGLTTNDTEHSQNNWFDGRVPASVIALIDDYLYVRQHRVPTLLGQCASEVKTLDSLPAAVLRALELKPTLPVEVYVDAIVSALDATAARYNESRQHQLVFSHQGHARDILLCTAHRCSRRLLDACYALYRFEIVHTVYGLVQRDVLAHDVVAGWALCVAEALVASDYASIWRTAVAVSLTELLAIVAPEAVTAFLTAWAASLPPTLEAQQDNVYRALEQLHSVLGAKHRNIFVQLAATCRDALVAGGALDPMPDLPDFVYDDIPVDRAHCRRCAAFAAFLADGTSFWTDRLGPGCRSIHAVIAAHPDRLEERQEDLYVIIKVPRPGHATVDDLISHNKQQSQRAEDRKMVTVLEAWMAKPSTDIVLASRGLG